DSLFYYGGAVLSNDAAASARTWRAADAPQTHALRAAYERIHAPAERQSRLQPFRQIGVLQLPAGRPHLLGDRNLHHPVAPFLRNSLPYVDLDHRIWFLLGEGKSEKFLCLSKDGETRGRGRNSCVFFRQSRRKCERYAGKCAGVVRLFSVLCHF